MIKQFVVGDKVAWDLGFGKTVSPGIVVWVGKVQGDECDSVRFVPLHDPTVVYRCRSKNLSLLGACRG